VGDKGNGSTVPAKLGEASMPPIITDYWKAWYLYFRYIVNKVSDLVSLLDKQWIVCYKMDVSNHIIWKNQWAYFFLLRYLLLVMPRT
jgi:hypothetical protein